MKSTFLFSCHSNKYACSKEVLECLLGKKIQIESGGTKSTLVVPKRLWWNQNDSGGTRSTLVEPNRLWWKEIDSGGTKSTLVEPN